MSRLTPEREQEIRDYCKAPEPYLSDLVPNYKLLLAEIDALREETMLNAAKWDGERDQLRADHGELYTKYIEQAETNGMFEEELYELKAENEKLKGGFMLIHENERLRARVQWLMEALEKIADPRKRDHMEPDKYTEIGCVMHIANEALKETQG